RYSILLFAFGRLCLRVSCSCKASEQITLHVRATERIHRLVPLHDLFCIPWPSPRKCILKLPLHLASSRAVVHLIREKAMAEHCGELDPSAAHAAPDLYRNGMARSVDAHRS